MTCFDTIIIGSGPAGLSAALAAAGVQVVAMLNKSRGDFAYAMFDVANAPDAAVAKLSAVAGVIKVRVV